MEKQIMDLILITIDSILLLMLLHTICTPKKNKIISTLLMGTIITAETLALSDIITVNVLGNFIPIITVLLYSFWFLQGSLQKRIMSVGLVIVNLLIVNSIFIILGSLFSSSIYTLIYDSSDNLGYFLAVASKMILILEYLYLKYYFNKELEISPSVWKYILSILAITVIATSIILNEFVTKGSSTLYVGISIITFVSVNIIVFLLATLLTRQSNELATKEMIIQSAKYEEKISELALSKTEELNNLLHDQKQHIATLQEYIANGDKEIAEKYINDLIQLNKNDKEYIHTLNTTLNYILNEKIQKAKNLDINVTKKIICTDEGAYIENVYLSIILGNLLDNAIEACKEVTTNKFIDLKITITKEKTTIIINNSTIIASLSLNKNLKSTKGNNIRKGRGLTNVTLATANYDGVFEYFAKNHVFTVRCELFNLKG